MGLFSNKRKKAQDLFQTGAKGVGTVLQVRDTGMTVNENPRVAMVFRVEPLDGQAAFDAQKTTTVSRVEIPRQGERYPIWYDPEDPASSWAYATVAERQRPRHDATALRGGRGDVRRDGGLSRGRAAGRHRGPAREARIPARSRRPHRRGV